MSNLPVKLQLLSRTAFLCLTFVIVVSNTVAAQTQLTVEATGGYFSLFEETDLLGSDGTSLSVRATLRHNSLGIAGMLERYESRTDPGIDLESADLSLAWFPASGRFDMSALIGAGHWRSDQPDPDYSAHIGIGLHGAFNSRIFFGPELRLRWFGENGSLSLDHGSAEILLNLGFRVAGDPVGATCCDGFTKTNGQVQPSGECRWALIRGFCSGQYFATCRKVCTINIFNRWECEDRAQSGPVLIPG